MILFCGFLLFPVGLTCLLNFKNFITKKTRKKKNREMDVEEEYNLISTYDTGFVDKRGNVSSVSISDTDKK